jgi:hypothetical protein
MDSHLEPGELLPAEWPPAESQRALPPAELPLVERAVLAVLAEDHRAAALESPQDPVAAAVEPRPALAAAPRRPAERLEERRCLHQVRQIHQQADQQAEWPSAALAASRPVK